MEEIFREHAKTVYKYLMSMTGSADLSEELTQETFYQAIRSSDRYDGSCKITTWLCAIAKNQYRVYCRKHREMPDMETIPPAAAEQEVLSRMGSVEIIRQIHLLDDPYREVLYLRLFGDLSFAEIGTICQKTENWARVTYYRGKEKVRIAMERQEEKNV